MGNSSEKQVLGLCQDTPHLLFIFRTMPSKFTLHSPIYCLVHRFAHRYKRISSSFPDSSTNDVIGSQSKGIFDQELIQCCGACQNSNGSSYLQTLSGMNQDPAIWSSPDPGPKITN